MITTYPPRRPKSKRLLWIGLILAALALVVTGVWWYYQASLQAPSLSDNQVVFVVSPDESVQTIADNLQVKGLIKNSFFFRLYLRQSGLAAKIQAGDFKLRPNMTAAQIANSLNNAPVDLWVRLVEGWRVEQMAQLLEEKLGITQASFLAKAKEGYMFPDTYLIPREASANDVAKILTDNFNRRINDKKIRDQIKGKELTFEELVILASIVEREAHAGLEERRTIAGILLNRLEIGMALQADATVQYALGDSGEWWPKISDPKSVSSPYNTYLRPGLPPAPIANPGLEALQAVANPTDTAYFYYLHDRDGQVHYARDLDEHNQNVAQYLR